MYHFRCRDGTVSSLRNGRALIWRAGDQGHEEQGITRNAYHAGGGRADRAVVALRIVQAQTPPPPRTYTISVTPDKVPE